MLSPCIKVCQIDAHAEVCIGCGRTEAEIGAWSMYSDAERLEIMERVIEEGFSDPDFLAQKEGATQSESPQASANGRQAPPPPQAVYVPVDAREIEVREACRKYPASVLIDGIPYGESVLAMVYTLQRIVEEDLDGHTAKSLARQALTGSKNGV
ncbi:hypothetical protein SAMN05216526_0205 [Ectothiorhodosinus mongolicus]|uniref:DUF1289 domain-containing protein n=1 Tax=Ectothiorhodosinus mongolicus TaxID=233100 RepID=A0A1R3VMN9_9GAMM|nr:DUF1289 domain-containing protein [Ectothiorhodosinus mongolicus]ULX56250.1 DUF1289 domain-containing protein [Ectothiorhodosinus mongolicus]SIT65754.1 hypothetical protein SAMN05216526_0205 [Ectothiorhodosinus mongolicus]